VLGVGGWAQPGSSEGAHKLREPGARMGALGTVDFHMQPFLGLVRGIVTLGALCLQQGSGIGKSSFG